MTAWVDKYLGSTWSYGGRTLPNIDCYGLVRCVRAELFGDERLPEYGNIAAGMPLDFTRAYMRTAAECFEECEPEIGALACVFTGRACTHIAIIVELEGRMAVLETGSKTGPMWSRLQQFQARYARIRYYRAKTQ